MEIFQEIGRKAENFSQAFLGNRCVVRSKYFPHFVHTVFHPDGGGVFPEATAHVLQLPLEVIQHGGLPKQEGIFFTVILRKERR